MPIKKCLIILLFQVFSFSALAQDNYQLLAAQLDSIALERPGMLAITRIDISGLTLYEVITAIAEEHELNVSVSNDLNELVRTNLFNVPVRDVLLFLADNYQLEVRVLNGILIFKKRDDPPPVEKKKVLPEILIDSNTQNDFLSVN